MGRRRHTLLQRLKKHEKAILISELQHDRKLWQTAEALGIRYCTLWRKMREHGISSTDE